MSNYFTRNVLDQIRCINLCQTPFRQRLHGTGSVWNRYEIGTDKPCIYTGHGGSGTDRICYLVPMGPLMKVIPYETVPFHFRTGLV